MPTHIQLHPADPAPADTPILGRPGANGPRPPAPSSGQSIAGTCRVKDATDFVAALALGLIALPVIAVSALVVKLTSRGPAFYTPDARRPRRPPIYDLQDPHHDP